MYFAYEEVFWLLLAIPALVLLFIWTSSSRRREEAEIMSEEMFLKLAPGRRPRRHLFSLLFSLAAMFAMIIAMSGPLIGAKVQEVRQRGIDVIFALDVSDSMRAEDVKPDRFQVARRIAEYLSEKLRANEVALITFAGGSFLECPLTLDQGAFRMLLSATGPGVIPSGGSDSANAVKKALETFSTKQNRGKMLIIISDGENLQGDYQAAAKEAARLGIVINCIGVGYPEGAPIAFRDPNGDVVGYKKDSRGEMVLTRMDPTVLRTIAGTAGGKFYDGSGSLSEFTSIVKKADKMKKGELESKKADRYENRFAYFLFIGLVLLVIDTIWPEAAGRRSVQEEPL